MSLVQVRLARDSMQTPWGFRLQGGKDLNQSLTVQRVFANTPSERELHRGDVIVAINGRDTSSLTHKQAQDAISGGGGQIELLVERPSGHINIKPLTPATDTRAPSFPQSPTRAPQIVIPIQRNQGPLSPTRTIPISPHKPSPPKHPAKPVQDTEQNRDMSAGFMPKKVTLNKYGGGGPDYGSSYSGAFQNSPPQKTPQSHSYRPVAAPIAAPVAATVSFQPAIDQFDYSSSTQQSQEEQRYQSQTQFSAPQNHGAPPPSSEERGVEEEEYGGVNERRRTFMKGEPHQPTIQRSRKPTPTFGRARAHGDSSYTSFGVDYTKPQTQPQSQPKPSSSRPRPAAVNARREEDDLDGQSWSNTLRSEGKHLKPWELEAMQTERYQSSTADEPYRPQMQPTTAPKPRIVQISAQSTARPPPEQNSPSAGYSSSQQKKPLVPGERDWNDSFVYQMIHSSQKTTSSSRQDATGQPPKGETVSTSRVTHETKYPGQEPQRRVTETIERGGAPDYKFDNAIGMSDF